MARVSPPRLEELVREAEVLSTLKASVPHAWKILEHEIGLARIAAATQPPHPPPNPHTPRHPPSLRKRVKLRVPAEKYPDYNFVGRLLGPRGATLKRLERETRCRIMIRGKGSIRKDKEAEVRGKPGWEHVFHEPLHVVIEVVDIPDEHIADRILASARDIVELLLVPVPEERDSLKRAQLRDLAILNGTHRSSSPAISASTSAVAAAAAAAVGVEPLVASGHTPLASPRSSPPPPSPPPLTRRASHGAVGAKNLAHKPLYNPAVSADGFLQAFEPSGGVAFTRPGAPSPFTTVASPPPQRHVQQPQQPPVGAGTFPSGSPRETTPLHELDKLRIPTLDFDHLSETNITMNSFGIPAASPTIVDPEIYPYPSTPGLLNVDHQIQLGAFTSPVWTPPRSMSSGPMSASGTSSVTAPAGALPPRSPRAPDGSQPTNAFLLGRALNEPPSTSGQGAFQRSSSLREGEMTFEEAFASRATVGGERGVSEFAPHNPPFVSGRDGGEGGQIGLTNFFPGSGGLGLPRGGLHGIEHDRLPLGQSPDPGREDVSAQPKQQTSVLRMRTAHQTQAQHIAFSHQEDLSTEVLEAKQTHQELMLEARGLHRDEPKSQ
eukprot:GFKZ01010253.1.p1 GENE.GFKZ01010253.1~~GFKZ01010253.1.p1  ORF type:complete len:632 (-),score=66.08 GFKZ01010253.1:589-2406(-)